MKIAHVHDETLISRQTIRFVSQCVVRTEDRQDVRADTQARVRQTYGRGNGPSEKEREETGRGALDRIFTPAASSA